MHLDVTSRPSRCNPCSCMPGLGHSRYREANRTKHNRPTFLESKIGLWTQDSFEVLARVLEYG